MIFLFLLGQLVPNFAPLPNPILTPGALAMRTDVRVDRPLSIREVCTTKWGKDTRHVTTALRKQVFARYGIAWTPENRKLYEVDHLIPREMGGADTIENLWPQLWNTTADVVGAHVKDRVENAAHRFVCRVWVPGTDSGEDALVAFQEAFASNWLGVLGAFDGVFLTDTFLVYLPVLHPVALLPDEVRRECMIVEEGGEQPYPHRPAGLKESGMISIACPRPDGTFSIVDFCAGIGIGQPSNVARYDKLHKLLECWFDKGVK